MCDCVTQITRTYTADSTCAGVTIELLDLYKKQIEIVVSAATYQKAATNQNECAAALRIIDEWQTVKQSNPGSCDYQEYFPVLQDLIKRIILSK